MRINWDKRGKKYYAYLRDSKFVNGKTTTTNVYLGADLVTAKTKLFDYAQIHKLPSEELYRQLHSQAIQLDVPIDLCGDRRLKEKALLELYNKIRDLIDKIPEAKTIELRKTLHRKLSMLVLEYKTETDDLARSNTTMY
jgi:hypothetical protein